MGGSLEVVWTAEVLGFRVYASGFKEVGGVRGFVGLSAVSAVGILAQDIWARMSSSDPGRL